MEFFIFFSIVLVGVLVALSFFLFYKQQQIQHLKKILFISGVQFINELKQQEFLATKLTQLQAKFEHDILHDSVTGLPTLQIFEDRLQQIIKQSERHQLIFGVVLLNLDGFKLITNALGHEVAKNLLKEVGWRLRNLIRKVDSVSHFTGNEFGIILSQLSKPETAAYALQRILDGLSQPFKVGGQELFITGSIGVATFPLDGTDANTLLNNAYSALHQAKVRGRNTFQFYQAKMHAASQRELILSQGLQKPQIYDQFQIMYQPRINNENKQIVGVEAQLFWRHADFGKLEFIDFLRSAENNGTIIEIGEWFLTEALEQFLHWKNFEPQLDTLAVSVSIRQLENSHFAYKLSQLLKATESEPTSLILEISESTLHFQLDLVERMLNMLKHLGVQIGIKNFGSGHLSLQNLKSFPVDFLIIPKEIVQGITVNKENAAMVKMIVTIAQSLQIKAIAEGVDTEKQKELLSQLGCNIMQGLFFSPPLLGGELTAEKMSTLLAFE